MCALGTRKALELAVKWVYAAAETIQEPYRDNLMSLIHEESFRFSMERGTWVQLLYIVRLGNTAAHSETSVTASEAVTALKGLFEFIQWIEYCYAKDYTPRMFDESLIPQDTVALDRKKILQQQSLLEYIENGDITLIASTTENPYFYVYNALLSRCTVFEFKPLEYCEPD